jgi:metal-sulfur cluster biosynthetic enzyme
MVRDVQVDGARVALEVTLTVAGCPMRNEIQSRVGTALAGIGEVATRDFIRSELRGLLETLEDDDRDDAAND